MIKWDEEKRINKGGFYKVKANNISLKKNTGGEKGLIFLLGEVGFSTAV